MSDKSKEYWITLRDGGGVDDFYDPYEKDSIHVIEYSAYEELKADLALAVEALEKPSSWHHIKCEKVKFFHIHEKYKCDCGRDKAKEVLAKLKVKGE